MNILLIGEAGRLGPEPALRRRGHRVTEARSDRALALARELAPDLILLDVGAFADHTADAPDLGGSLATRSVPVLSVDLGSDPDPDWLIALVERVAGTRHTARRPARSSAASPATGAASEGAG